MLSGIFSVRSAIVFATIIIMSVFYSTANPATNEIRGENDGTGIFHRHEHQSEKDHFFRTADRFEFGNDQQKNFGEQE